MKIAGELIMRLIITMILLLLTVTIFAEKHDPFVGLWSTKDNESIVEIYKNESSEYLGKIVWLKEPLDDNGNPLTDSENPVDNKQSLPLIGLGILSGFMATSHPILKDGTIYDPENGKTYSCTIKLKKADLIIRGFIGISLLGRSEKWTKCLAIP